MGHSVPKQFLMLKGKILLTRTIEAFYHYDRTMEIVLVLPAHQTEFWHELCEDQGFSIAHSIAEGGETRYHSVKNGLAMAGSAELVGIHDGVRPLVNRETIARCYDTAGEKGNAIPALISRESVRLGSRESSRTVDRDSVWLIQTPQVFRREQLQHAYDQPCRESFTDDASVVEASGQAIHLVEGNPENIKITTPLDLEIVEGFLM